MTTDKGVQDYSETPYIDFLRAPGCALDHLWRHVRSCAEAFSRLNGVRFCCELCTKTKVCDFDFWVGTRVAQKDIHVLQIPV